MALTKQQTSARPDRSGVNGRSSIHRRCTNAAMSIGDRLHQVAVYSFAVTALIGDDADR
jgi:hypothetical protein